MWSNEPIYLLKNLGSKPDSSTFARRGRAPLTRTHTETRDVPNPMKIFPQKRVSTLNLCHWKEQIAFKYFSFDRVSSVNELHNEGKGDLCKRWVVLPHFPVHAVVALEQRHCYQTAYNTDVLIVRPKACVYLVYSHFETGGNSVSGDWSLMHIYRDICGG